VSFLVDSGTVSGGFPSPSISGRLLRGRKARGLLHSLALFGCLFACCSSQDKFEKIVLQGVVPQSIFPTYFPVCYNVLGSEEHGQGREGSWKNSNSTNHIHKVIGLRTVSDKCRGLELLTLSYWFESLVIIVHLCALERSRDCTVEI
jgi:hypothetical protein